MLVMDNNRRKNWHLGASSSNLCTVITTKILVSVGPTATIIICWSCDNNHVAKIGVLGPAAPIFAEITWIIIGWSCHERQKCHKNWCSGPSGSNLYRNHVDHYHQKLSKQQRQKNWWHGPSCSNLVRNHVDYYFETVYLLETQPTNYF